MTDQSQPSQNKTTNSNQVSAPQATTQSSAPAQTQAGVPLVPASQDELVKVIGKYRVRVTRPKCIGAASCVAIAPDVFALDEENIAKFLDGEEQSSEELLLAAQSCPTAAIEIIDQDSGQKLWPL